MTPTYNKIHKAFKLNGNHHSYSDLTEVAYSFIKEGDYFEKEVGRFLADWLDDKPYIESKTSGSTGAPKSIRLQKQAMVHSALATGDFFKLKPGDTALHCLPSGFIAGKMMLVRAMILGLELDLIKPATVLQFNLDKSYDFCAMVPMQLQSNLSKSHRIKTIIVGGAPVSQPLVQELQSLKTQVYETYGMTETITHIAVKPLNQSKNKNSKVFFNTLPNIAISQDDRACLIIKAPKLTSETIMTNDVVTLHSKTTFEWLGRFDHVINSGGVKLFPEQIEAKLQPLLTFRFFIASEPDEILGEKLILVIESETNALDFSVFEVLDTFERPRAIYALPEFIETSSGKIQRKKTLNLIN